ncbi:unnamed protein product [Symbiodinium natans]|uniref:Transmembrane protein n=1 Tax=Symbiodinium natans TaxID=878477 RepID=A0A812S6F3_9DINO|nr:unnamed protein product [Symbiodinium natans]
MEAQTSVQTRDADVETRQYSASLYVSIGLAKANSSFAIPVLILINNSKYPFEELVAQLMSRMKPASADIVRCVFAYQDLDMFFGVATALFLYNALPATLISTTGAATVAILYGAELIEGMNWSWRDYHTYEYPRSYWALVVGFVLYILTMVFWRPNQSVFVDRLCISQDDARQKVLGLFSMGAFLKFSDSILVLWDETYMRWCVFELSGFLHSRQGAQPKMLILPTVLGPCCMLLTLSLFAVTAAVGAIPDGNNALLWTTQALVLFIGMYVVMAAIRDYFRSIATLEQDLRNFTIDKEICYALLCDRDVLLRTIALWYGTVEAFERRVQTEVRSCLMQQLSKDFFSYWQCIASLIPIALAFIDTTSAEWRLDASRNLVFEGVAWWLGIAPSILLLSMRVAHVLRAKRRCDWLQNVLVLVCIVALFVTAVQLERYCFLVLDILPKEHRHLSYGMALQALVWIPIAALLFRCLGVHPRYNCSQKPQTAGLQETSPGHLTTEECSTEEDLPEAEPPSPTDTIVVL